MGLEIKIVEPSFQPAKTMRRSIPVFGIVALRRRDSPGLQVAGFGKTRGKSGACFLGRTIDLEHQDKLVAGLAKRRVENAVTSVLDRRPGLPCFQVVRGEDVDRVPPVRARYIHRAIMNESAAELVSVRKRRQRVPALMIDKTKVVGFSLIV